MNKHIAFLVVAFVLVTLGGCKKDNRPEDLPPLFPCVVTITQEGVPLEGAAVSFAAVDGSNAKYRAVGTTNAEGKATMKTYSFEGSPTGKFKVAVRKLVVEEGATTTNSDGEEVASNRKEYQAVEQKFIDAKTTPHEIEITGDKNTVEATFDVGKAQKK